jgi:DNA-binding NarL/FixJ family response regulator
MAPRILIVDDQREVSRLLRSALETIEQGLDVAEAPSGEEALLDASRKKVDLLVADFRLPGINGAELMSKIKARHPQAKVILITGVSDPRTREELARSGADAFFTKPIPMADFLDAVERTLGLTRTILPDEQAHQQQPTAPQKSMAGLLAGLRKHLHAQAVILVNDRGHIKAQAGELPDPNIEVSLIAALMAIYSAGQKASSLLRHDIASGLHIFHTAGSDCDVILAPVGPLHSVLVAGRDIASPEKLKSARDVLSAARLELEKLLAKMGVTGQLPPQVAEDLEAAQAAVQQQSDPKAAEVAEVPPDFDALLTKAKGAVETDADSFWEAAAEKGASFTLSDTLTYDEARKLGLTPGADG